MVKTVRKIVPVGLPTGKSRQGKSNLPDGWLTGIIFLTVVPVGGSQENFRSVRFRNLFSVSATRQGKDVRK
jgi:hypothetical protein